MMSMLQWGRGRLTADDVAVVDVEADAPRLQWGRGRLTADDIVLSARGPSHFSSFNGAAVG